MTAARVPGLPDHLLVDEAGHTAGCTVCGMSVVLPYGRFGPIAATDMLAAFVFGHAVHDRSGMPNGLTATGKPRKAAAAVVEAAMRGEGGT